MLQGEEARRAIEAAVAIARDLAGPPPPVPPGGAAPLDVGVYRPSVASGYAGQALFYFYLDQQCPDQGFGERSAVLLDRAIEYLASAETAPELYGGFTGVAWAGEIVQSLGSASAGEDVNEEIDQVLRELLDSSPWTLPYDLTSGLVGYGVYALRRLPRPLAVECLELVVDRLAELAVERDGGITWHTPAEMLGKEEGEFFTEGFENLGVAHGVPGVIAVLGRVCAAGVAAAKARPLLEGAVRWVLAQKMEGRDSIFPTAKGRGVEVRYSRAAWCYGDPGVAATFLVAARALGVAEWEAEALALARHSARRPEETMGVRDACLCHGSAGLAHLFNRVYQATGEPILREASLSWYRHVLEGRQPGRGLGGFLGWGMASGREVAWNADPSFLTGAAGIGLALLAGAGEVEPKWDELLLVSPLGPSAAPAGA